jgi:aldehyde dehydrogenase (NAD(P)+)
MQALQSPEPRTVSALAATIDRVKSASSRFARLGIPERIQLLRQMRQGYRAIAEESVLAACRAKGINPDNSIAGEEWMSGPWIVIRNLRLLEAALQDVRREGTPRISRSWIKSLPDGRLAINVFPSSALDSILLPKYSVEVHLQPGITEKNLRQHQASFYRAPHAGKLCVVLGAGNVNAAHTRCSSRGRSAFSR